MSHAGARIGSQVGLLAPAASALTVLLAAPLLLVSNESLRVYVPGYVGARADAPFTAQHYLDLIGTAYLGYFADTFRIGVIAALLGLAVGYLIAYRVARETAPRRRRAWIGFLVAMLFLSILVRVYAAALTFGPSGFGRSLSALLGVGLNSREYAEFTVILGLLHCLIPMAAIALVGPLQNLNPRLVEAAQALGAPRWKAHATVTLPLSARGALSAFMLCFSFAISAFVIPLVLGKGRVLFVSNLIYSRFGEVGNYPAGAAMAIALLLLSLGFVYTVSRAASYRWEP